MFNLYSRKGTEVSAQVKFVLKDADELVSVIKKRVTIKGGLSPRNGGNTN